MFASDQKRLLALDGGGILGLISLQILKKIEDDLKAGVPNPQAFRLRDYFDYIGGTSTGAIMATGLALGWSVDDLIRFYEKHGSKMFTRAWLWNKPFHKYTAGPLSKLLREQIGEETILQLQQSGRLSTDKHLLIVTHNLSTDSPWPLSTNPKAKYNVEDHPECNRKIPLWQLVRASAAAPTYFPPQDIELPRGVRKFEDGGVTPYNNPALLLHRMATLSAYRCEWPDGETRMMIVSVGAGCSVTPQPGLRNAGRHLISNAESIPTGLMQRISDENDIKCRTVGRCVFGAPIDSELGDLMYPLDKHPEDLGRRFLYARYNPILTKKGLADLRLTHLEHHSFEIDNVSPEQLQVLTTVGKKYAELVDIAGQFPSFVAEPQGKAA